MDNLAHSLFGAHLARLPAFRKLPDRTAFWTCVAASNLPDLDILLRLGGETDYLFGHRGLTHSFVGIAVLAPLVGLVAALLSRRPLRAVLPGLTAVALAGLGGHLLLDTLTSWGTMLLAPFSDQRFALPWLFIADPWIWLLLGIPLAWGRWRKRRGVPARVLSRIGVASLTALSLYACLCGLAWGRARVAAFHQLSPEAGRPVEVLAFPAPFGPLIWTTLVRTDDQLWHRGFASALTGGVTPAGTFSTGRADPRVQIALDTPIGRRYGWFAAAPYRARATPPADDGSFEVAVGDLRFSNPFTDRLPMVLWMRIGPHFDVEEHRLCTALLPP